MALTKQPVNVNFQMGLDTKNDPYQIPVGKFLAINNSVFDTVGRMTKRNGFGSLPTLSINIPYISTFNDNLIAIGNSFHAYSKDTSAWVTGSIFFPVDLSVVSLVRSPISQIQTDSVVASNGIVCTVYSETIDQSFFVNYSYSISDSSTGQSFVTDASLSNASGTPRVFALGNYFVIVYSTSTPSLEYIAINISTFAVGSPTTITSDYTPAASVSFDGAVSTNLYLAWCGSSSNGMYMITLSPTLVLGTATSIDGGHSATIVGVWIDTTQSPISIWVGYWDVATGNGYVLIRNPSISPILAPTLIISSVATVYNITGTAVFTNGIFMYEYKDNWSYDTTLANSDTKYVPVTQAGVISTAVVQKSMGLGSKGFVVSNVSYVTLVYGTKYQPSYFIVQPQTSVSSIFNASACIAKFAYQNGGGFLTTGLPSVSVSGTTARFSYLFKDFIEAINKGTALASGTSTGIYSQTGINLLVLTLFATDTVAVEAGANLNVSGGFLWGWDGSIVTENNFFLWPELQLNGDGTFKGATVTNVSLTPTGTTVAGSNIISSISDSTGLEIGMAVSGSGLVSGTTVVGFNANGAIISIPASGSHSGSTYTFVSAVPNEVLYYVFIYQWVDNQGNEFNSAPSIPVLVNTTSTGANSEVTIIVPNLPMTYKGPTLRSPKIVGFRWSASQQVYYQFTSILSPYYNNTANQTTTIVDCSSKATILGNPILYTTGGVVENINPVSTNKMTLFDDRLWLVDAEDQNLLWFSKQIIEATPVEMSDLLTFFIAPTIAGRGSSGIISALGAMDDKLIIFKEKDAIYYINGTGPDNTGANNQYSQPIFVTSPVTCKNQSSITLIPSGLMFQSDNGIWLLGRNLEVSYIGAPVQQYNSHSVTSANTIPGTTQVRFTLDNGTILMYDYFVNEWCTFSGVTSTHITSSTIYNDLHTTIDTTGAVTQETSGTYSDGASPVLMSFTTGWINIAGLRGYERSYFFFLLGTYLSRHTLTIGIAYDYDSTIVQTSTFTPTGYTKNEIENFRVFLEKQRCKAFQLTITESLPNGASADAGLTISGLNMMIGFKKSYAPISAAKSIG